MTAIVIKLNLTNFIEKRDVIHSVIPHTLTPPALNGAQFGSTVFISKTTFRFCSELNVVANYSIISSISVNYSPRSQSFRRQQHPFVSDWQQNLNHWHKSAPQKVCRLGKNPRHVHNNHQLYALQLHMKMQRVKNERVIVMVTMMTITNV